MDYDEIIRKLESMGDPAAIEGMARFGITPEKTYGVSMPALIKLAKEIGIDHELAGKLWSSNIRETHIITYLINNPQQITKKQIKT